jgi:type IV pilus assembly protein PilO
VIRINLLPVREARRKAGVRQQVMLLAVALAGAVVLSGGFHQWMRGRISATQGRVISLQAQLEKFKPQQEQVAEFKAKKAEIEQKLAVIANLERSRSGPVHIMDELATHIPERVWLTGVTADKGQIALGGMSLDNELVALFLTSLNDSPYFANVELESTELKLVDSLKLNTFRIRAALESPDAPAAAATPAAAAQGARRAPAQAHEGEPLMDLGLDQITNKLERFSKLPRAYRMAAIPVLCGLVFGLYGYVFYQPARQELTRVEEQERELQRKVSEVRAIVANLAAFEKELTDLEQKLKLALRQLPDSKELPVLLTDISSLGKDAGLEFKLFKPKEEIARDFYAEVPIEIEFSGSFHDIARFFDKISKLPRIVNISRMDMTPASADTGSSVLNVRGEATTFRFVEQKAAPAQAGAQPKAGAPQKSAAVQQRGGRS